ncbi:MAG: hypothetical protein KF849_04385 [Rhizobiaceae bacterium]|nr:hypothetical protein [Rhizobiaceae bacterium]
MPGWRTALVGTPLWAALLAASAAAWLLLLHRFETSQWQTILAVFALGGLLAFPSGLFAARLLAPGASVGPRFAASFLCMGLASVLGVAFVFSMQYRVYYAQWHEPFPTIPWFFQLAFTGAGAVYQFAVLGVRMLFPVAFVALFAFSLWHARALR